MKKSVSLLGALGVGAGLMYLLDPDKGKRRRAGLRDRAVRLSNEASRQINKKGANLRNQFQGVWFEAERIFENETPTDEQLEGKIRARLGRLTSHPHAVKTTVENGKVVLSGLILADEVEPLLKAIGSIGGVNEIENNLKAHETAENISSLQGENRVRRTILERNAQNWSPTARILAALTGGSLIAFGVKKRNAFSSLGASVGTALLTRSAVNKPLAKLFATKKKAIKIRKTINIDAPRERVFDVLSYPEYFPYFMSHVRSVEKTGEKQYLWKVDGIAGYPVEWTTEVTQIIPNELIRWENAGEKRNGQNGFLRFEKAGEGKTRLHVEMNYQPLAGTFGHFIAALFSRDPKSELDDDFLRLKAYVEKGRFPHDAAALAAEKRRKQIKVKEIMTENPVTVTLNTSLHDVAQKMAENDCGIIPVLENIWDLTPVGVITDRDIAIRTIAHNKNPLNMVAGEVMTDPVVTVTPEITLDDCVKVLERNQIRRVLVVDEAGSLSGIVAQADIARTAPPLETAGLVKDVSLTQAAAA
jgi:uncharacterized membrane protein/CBS domain-containing protein/uncharacterized protein YwbE